MLSQGAIQKVSIKIVFSSILAVFSFHLSAASVFADTISLKIQVANPSDTETRTLAVKTYLPKGVGIQDVVDRGNFNIAFDYDKSLYYAYQEATLKPSQSMSFQMVIKDIWIIDLKEINDLVDHSKKLMEILGRTSNAAQAKTMGQQILQRLNKVLDDQHLADLPINQRVSNYEADRNLLSACRKDIGLLEDMVLDTGAADLQKRLGTLMGEDSLEIDPMQDINNLDVLQFKIEITNPSLEERPIPFKYYFPIEVKPDFVVNTGGLDLVYDYQQGLYYATKPNLTLKSGESKRFAIQIKDLWVVPENKIRLVRRRANKAVNLLEETPYEKAANYLQVKINTSMQEIADSQNNKNSSVDGHIGLYRLNLEKYNGALKDLTELEKLVIQFGGSVSENGRVSASAYQSSRVEGLRSGHEGIKILDKTIFKALTPDIATTWKLIWIILAFVAVVSFLFFILWWRQEKSNQNKKYKNVQDNHRQS